MLALAATNASVLPLTYLNPYAPGISLTQGIAGWYGHPTVLAHHVAAVPLVYSAHTLGSSAATHALVAPAAEQSLTLNTHTSGSSAAEQSLGLSAHSSGSSTAAQALVTPDATRTLIAATPALIAAPAA